MAESLAAQPQTVREALLEPADPKIRGELEQQVEQIIGVTETEKAAAEKAAADKAAEDKAVQEKAAEDKAVEDKAEMANPPSAEPE